MNAVIVTCFESNEERVGYIKKTIENLGYKTDVISSDFSHIKKAVRNNIPEGYLTVKTRPYKKNLSVGRLVSHYYFAKDAFKMIENMDVDLLWVMAPCNSLIKEADSYKKKHPEVRLVIDIIDMWPESLPVSFDKNIFPLNIWKNIRTNYLNCADELVVECEFYKEVLSTEYKGNITTLRWAKEDRAIEEDEELSDDKLSLVYLGSINNIIDIEGIKKMVMDIDYPTVLHIVGEGEKTQDFIDSLKEVSEVVYHGVVREKNSKKEILKKCHAGINFYKEGLYIGLTVKCIDYFLHGLPIINNIKGDTWLMVEEDGVGFNMSENRKIKAEDIMKLRKDHKHFADFYNGYFTYEIFDLTVKEIIKRLK